MADELRTLRLLTGDESLLASVRAAAQALEGWELAVAAGPDELLRSAPTPGDVILLDAALRPASVYEVCRELTGRIRCRTFVVTERGNRLAEPIAQFCGATGTLSRPLSAADLRRALEHGEARPEPARAARGAEPREALLPERLLRDVQGEVDSGLVGALTDPETGLYNYGFLHFKLEEEFKRAQRFGHPLSCVMLGFEGQASPQVLRELAGIFLSASRDTDVLGRFDENSFLFLLPSTGPDGAQVMAKRVGERAEAQGLRDLVGDPLQIAVGIAFHPHAEVRRRDDLFGRARKAFFAARAEGGGVVTSS